MSLQGAREAAAGGDWKAGYELLMEADSDGLLGSADLPLLAEVAYAAGDLDVTIEAWERAHALGVEAGDAVAAAGAAVRVAMHLLLDTALMAPVRGWLARAEQLLEGQQETPAHAWLAVVRTYERMLIGDVQGARQWSERAIDVGSKHDVAACAVGRVAGARLRILDGESPKALRCSRRSGWRRSPAISTRSRPGSCIASSCALCRVWRSTTSRRSGRRRWSDGAAPTRSAASMGDAACTARRSCGCAARATTQSERRWLACDELRPYLRREMGWPLSELGRIRLRKGDLDGAEEALLAAHRAGWEPQPGLALVSLARGDFVAAAAAIRDALEHPSRIPSKERPPDTQLQRAPLLDAQVEIEIAGGDLERARAAAGELERVADRFQSKALVAAATLAQGRVRLAEGDAADAERHCSHAARLWNEIGAPYEAAIARMVHAEALRAGGNDEHAVLESRAARAVLDRIEVSVGAATETNAFRREGDYWSVDFEGRTVHVRDLKGMRHLAQLLAHPGREFHVLDLVGAETGPPMALGDAGELLDERAKTAYRRRLAEIEADIEQARALEDDVQKRKPMPSATSWSESSRARSVWAVAIGGPHRTPNARDPV